MLHQKLEQALIAQCRAEQRFVVAGQDPAPCLRLLARHLGQAFDQGFAQRMLDRAVGLVALQVFAAGSGGEAVGLDHPADEPGPRRQ